MTKHSDKWQITSVREDKASPQTWLSITEQNKGRFIWQDICCHICPTAAEEAAHRKWYCSSGVPGRGHAVCPRHDCLQLLTRLHPRASGRTLFKQHQLQGISTPDLFQHLHLYFSKKQPTPDFTWFWCIACCEAKCKSSSQCFKMFDLIYAPSDTTAGDDGYRQKELQSLTQVTF